MRNLTLKEIPKERDLLTKPKIKPYNAFPLPTWVCQTDFILRNMRGIQNSETSFEAKIDLMSAFWVEVHRMTI